MGFAHISIKLCGFQFPPMMDVHGAIKMRKFKNETFILQCTMVHIFKTGFIWHDRFCFSAQRSA